MLYFIFYEYVFAYMHICVPPTNNAPWGQKKASDLRELE